MTREFLRIDFDFIVSVLFSDFFWLHHGIISDVLVFNIRTTLPKNVS